MDSQSIPPEGNSNSSQGANSVANNAPVIRTMKDDLSAAPPSPSAASTGSNRPITDVQPPNGQGRPLSFIAPETMNDPQASQPESGVQAPQRVSKRRSGRGTAKQAMNLIMIFLAVLLVGGGAGAGIWFFFLRDQNINSVETPTPENTEITQIIPASATTVIYYNVSTDANRRAVQTMWQTEASLDTPVRTAITGNPSLFAQYSSVTEVAYVFLPNDPRMYTVVKKTPETDQIFSTPSGAQVEERKGWYIVHPVSTSLYISALNTNNMASENIALDAKSMMTWIVDPTFLGSIYGDRRGSEVFQTKLSKMITLHATYDERNQKLSLITPATGTTSINREALLSYVPADITTLISGTNFSQDIISNTNLKSLFNAQTLQAPAVAQLASTLTSPYAYYERTGDDGIVDEGIVIQLSDDSTLKTGDPILQQWLTAFVPALVNRINFSTFAFAPAEYNGIPLEYINLQGSSKALDYAVVNNYLLIASSKEGMLELLDLAAQDPAIITSSYEDQLTVHNAGVTLQSYRTFIGFQSTYAGFADILPGKVQSADVVVGYNPTESGETSLSADILLHSPEETATPLPQTFNSIR